MSFAPVATVPYAKPVALPYTAPVGFGLSRNQILGRRRLLADQPKKVIKKKKEQAAATDDSTGFGLTKEEVMDTQSAVDDTKEAEVKQFAVDQCHCDSTCTTFMDCCPDYFSLCTGGVLNTIRADPEPAASAAGGSCQNKCNSAEAQLDHSAGTACYCDEGCSTKGDCCKDWKQFCAL